MRVGPGEPLRVRRPQYRPPSVNRFSGLARLAGLARIAGLTERLVSGGQQGVGQRYVVASRDPDAGPQQFGVEAEGRRPDPANPACLLVLPHGDREIGHHHRVRGRASGLVELAQESALAGPGWAGHHSNPHNDSLSHATDTLSPV